MLILVVFFIEQLMTVALEGPNRFFSRALFIVDFVVVAVSLNLELMALGLRFSSDYASDHVYPSYYRGSAVLVRVARLLRFAHGVYELAHGLHEMHEVHGSRPAALVPPVEDGQFDDFDDAFSWPLERGSKASPEEVDQTVEPSSKDPPEEVALTVEPSSKDPPVEVDFTGKWTCADQTGMDEFLRAMGAPYLARKAASAKGFGVGMQMTIERSAEGVWTARAFNFRMSWSLAHAVETATETVYAERCAGGVLKRIHPRRAGKPVCEMRRTLVDGRMVVKTSANGAEATRSFVRAG